MTPLFQLRKPTPEDAQALADLGRDTFIETFGPLYHPNDLNAHLTKNYGDDHLLAEISDPDLHFQVVERGNELIAFIKIGPLQLPVENPPPSAMEIRQLYVRQKFTSGGLGKALMAWAFEELKALKASEIHLSVFSENHRAIRFYQKLGFRKCGEYLYPVGNHLDLEWIMVHTKP